MNIATEDSHVGLYEKFRVERTDGRGAEGEKHHGCEYFVLDLNHDPFAYAAIVAYARKCADRYPALADDLLKRAGKMGGWMVEAKLNAMTDKERQFWGDMYWRESSR